MKKEKYVLGLDIGISSVGWGLVRLDEYNNPNHIIDAGVKIFSPGEVPKTGANKNLERREKRGSRRITRRREFRVDRIKYLLNLNGYLGNEIVTGKVSEVNEQLDTMYNDMVNIYYKDKVINPYILKVEALDRKLSKDELSIILVHYAKHRGYKSNRDEDIKDSDAGKVKENIKENKEMMEKNNYRIISEMFIKDEKFKDKIRNSKDNYKMSVTREMYFDEINKVLSSQVNYGLITNEFKDEYINIWSSQRHYSKGPGGNSKYGGDLIARMTGICKFDGLPRAPKCAPSSEIFVALTNLINFRFKEKRDNQYQRLNEEEIKKVIDVAFEQDSISYDKIFKILNIENGIVKGLVATNKEKQNAINSFMKQAKIEKFKYEDLDDEQRELYDKLKSKEVNKRKFIELKNYSIIRKQFVKQLGTDKWKEIKDNFVLLDKIVEILTNYKLDEDVVKVLKENNISEIYTDVILSLPNFKDHMMLSLELIRKLNKIMITGKLYDEAMSELGFNHSELNGNHVKEDLLIPINQDDEITNQRVIRSLTQTRGIINSIIKKYGMPERINIETARELPKTREERNKISKKRDENRENNQRDKEILVNLGLFESTDKITATDVLKYRLWIEQNAKCAYSLENIPREQLFDNNLVQIDHILPYSRTFNDSYFNKTLVLTKYNQEKGNKTPYEWFGKTDKWKEYEAYIGSLDIPETKKDNYLLTNLTPEMESEYRNQNLNDTKYISKYLVSYIKANLNVNKVGCPSGSITGKLRNYWNLNGLTHSLESDNYYVSTKEIEKKNRNNNLHHAMDALIIAVANDNLIRKVSNYERFKRYIDGRPLSYILDFVNNHNDDFDINEYVDENGEFNETSFREYVEELINSKNYIDKKNNTIRSIAPEPYKGFGMEAKIRVYEQNKDTMDFRLKEFNYTNSELEEAKPIIPKFAKEKAAGSLHGETYYSLRKNQDGIEEKISRIDIANSNFDEKKLERILDKNSGSKEVYLTIKEWLGTDKGDVAYKRNNGYPVNPKTGNYIKKIKIASDYNGKGHIIGNKLVDKEDICQIDVYKKENEDSLYFASYDALDLTLIKKGQNIDVNLWWGQGSNHKLYKRNELLNEYVHYLTLKKNNYVEIELNNGRKGRGYIVGCSSGLLEISSAIGDGYDLIGDDNLFNVERSQYQLTISTIKSIDIIKLNNLGKIE